jgi:predicted Zn-dependent protease
MRLAPEDPEALEGLRRLRSAEGDTPPEAREEPTDEPEPEARRARAITQLQRMMQEGAPAPAAGEGVAVGLVEVERGAGDVGARIAKLREQLRRAGPDQELSLQVALADLLLASNAAAEALPHARRAAALAPRDTTLLDRALGAAHAAGGAFAALDLLDDLIASAPDLGIRARLLAHRGDTLCDVLGWSTEAAHAWREALEADPRHAGARSRLASVRPPHA